MAHIIWIEDDYKRIGSMVNLLERDGHTIEPHESWVSAKENIEKICSSDAIILDIILPGENSEPYQGLWILEQLRNEYEYKGPVIICSRIQNPEVLRRLKQLGPTEILPPKPIRPSLLHKVVTEALEKVKAQETETPES